MVLQPASFLHWKPVKLSVNFTVTANQWLHNPVYTGGRMLTSTFSAEMHLISAFNSTLFSLLSCLLFSCLSGNPFPLQHFSSPSLWNSHTYCPYFQWGRPALSIPPCSHWNSPQPFPQQTSPHRFPPTSTDVSPPVQRSLLPLRGSFPRWDMLTLLSPYGSRLPARRLICFYCKAWALFSRGWRGLIFKWYGVNRWSNVTFPYSCWVNI